MAQEVIHRQGRFSLTSKDVHFDACTGKLSALCETKDQEWKPSSIDLNFYLANDDGDVEAATIRPGKFTHSCKDVKLAHKKELSGEARKVDDEYKHFTLDLDLYIKNDDGTLKWVAC